MANTPPVPGSSDRDRRRSAGRDDVLAGPPDYTRPANPWPRLIAFGLAVLGVFALAGLCVVNFADTPDREVRVRLTEFEPGLPKFIAIPTFGHDEAQNTYGAFLAVRADESAAWALLSKEPESGCNLRWEGATEHAGVLGVYVDPCSDARYAFDGSALHEGATRDLHRFDVRREVTSYVVSFEEITLGDCLAGREQGCSPPGTEVRREVPRGELPDGFGDR